MGVGAERGRLPPPRLFACCSGFTPLALFTLEDVGVYYPYSTLMPSGHKLKSGRWRRSNDGCIIRTPPPELLFLSHVSARCWGWVEGKSTRWQSCGLNMSQKHLHTSCSAWNVDPKTPGPNKHRQCCGRRQVRKGI